MAVATSPPWPPEMDEEAIKFGARLTEKYGGRVDYLGWVRWSSDFRMLRGNGVPFEETWDLINRNIDLIRSGQPEQPYPPGQYDVPWPPSMDEEANWFGPKLEGFYADPGNRMIDVLGWVRWSSDYRVHRANGITQENAWKRIENDIRRIWGLPIVLPPPGQFPTRTGNVVIDGRGVKDEQGRFLAVGYTQMHGAAECAKDRAAFVEDNTLLHNNGISYLRQIAMLDGSHIDPDPWIWGNDQGAGNTSEDRFIDAVNVAYDESGLRTFVTFWGGLKNWNTQEKRKAALRSLLPRLVAIKHKTIGGEVTNEVWSTGWLRFATYADMRELAAIVRSAMGPGWPLAMSAPSGVADDFKSDINAQFAEIRDMYYQNPVVNLTTLHFSREVKKIDKIWRVYRQPWDNRISVPAPDQTQNVAGFLGLPPGTQLTTDASSDNEPIGVDSSGEQDDNPDRIVLGIVLSFVAGCGMRVLHDDHGVWRDWINPVYIRADRGVTARVGDVRNISLILSGIQGMVRLLPGDLPSWSRTRHGDAPFLHPFSPSFQRQSNGFTQIWPDGYTTHGVVRAYCAVRGNDFVCPLLGVKDHFDLIAARNMKLVFIRPGGWEVIGSVTLAAGQKHVVTYPEVVTIGQYI